MDWNDRYRYEPDSRPPSGAHSNGEHVAELGHLKASGAQNGAQYGHFGVNDEFDGSSNPTELPPPTRPQLRVGGRLGLRGAQNVPNVPNGVHNPHIMPQNVPNVISNAQMVRGVSQNVPKTNVPKASFDQPNVSPSSGRNRPFPAERALRFRSRENASAAPYTAQEGAGPVKYFGTAGNERFVPIASIDSSLGARWCVTARVKSKNVRGYGGRNGKPPGDMIKLVLEDEHGDTIDVVGFTDVCSRFNEILHDGSWYDFSRLTCKLKSPNDRQYSTTPHDYQLFFQQTSEAVPNTTPESKLEAFANQLGIPLPPSFSKVSHLTYTPLNKWRTEAEGGADKFQSYNVCGLVTGCTPVSSFQYKRGPREGQTGYRTSFSISDPTAEEPVSVSLFSQHYKIADSQFFDENYQCQLSELIKCPSVRVFAILLGAKTNFFNSVATLQMGEGLMFVVANYSPIEEMETPLPSNAIALASTVLLWDTIITLKPNPDAGPSEEAMIPICTYLDSAKLPLLSTTTTPSLFPECMGMLLEWAYRQDNSKLAKSKAPPLVDNGTRHYIANINEYCEAIKLGNPVDETYVDCDGCPLSFPLPEERGANSYSIRNLYVFATVLQIHPERAYRLRCTVCGKSANPDQSQRNLRKGIAPSGADMYDTYSAYEGDQFDIGSSVSAAFLSTDEFHFYCNHCNNYESCDREWMISMTIADSTSQLRMICFGDVADKILGCTADEYAMTEALRTGPGGMTVNDRLHSVRGNQFLFRINVDINDNGVRYQLNSVTDQFRSIDAEIGEEIARSIVSPPSLRPVVSYSGGQSPPSSLPLRRRGPVITSTRHIG